MLIWMYGVTRMDKIRNEYIRESYYLVNAEVRSTEDRRRKTEDSMDELLK